jgi:hypothetical protein
MAPLLLIEGSMSEFVERLCLALVFLGVILLIILSGHQWVPLSASGNFHRHERSRPALPDWPHHGGLEDQA